ncbi:hypothetical protein [Cytobacillus gottheilii]|uniref:DUF2802 domain-containing protein n=1 Tax=Cytobacillus gottheilii TaxID=859144 RepID=A0ABX8FEI6_9BACI|nr:hypothetical protein [Cytobacillus gottheilii]QVY62414.1 hypothetical protein J1899_04740 [Cytobacillus gottheilii]
MGWVIAVLFGAAAVLLVLSFIKARKTAASTDQQIDQLSFSLMDEIHQLKQQIRNLELDSEIADTEAGIAADEKERKNTLREMLEMHRRGYSFESIAMKMKLTPNEVQQVLAPYMKQKDERSKVAQ